MDLSVIILSYNTKKLLQDCLKSVFASTGNLNMEVFVPDNGSTDGSVELIQQSYPAVKIIKLPENRGVEGYNQGISSSSGNILLLIDNVSNSPSVQSSHSK